MGATIYVADERIVCMDGISLVRKYYRLVDADENGSFSGVLSEDVVHHRPDMRIEGREEFATFIASGRPERETEHVIESLYLEHNGTKVAAEGQLYDSDGKEWFRFVDTFSLNGDSIEKIRTHTDIEPENH